MSTKNILICVSGLTPQIITESLYCLSVKEKIPVHEIVIITTARGRDVILGVDKAPSTPSLPLKNEISALCKKYALLEPQFQNTAEHIIVAKEESTELPDVRSDNQNKLFPNKVAEVIRNKSLEKETTLYCVISGGRKSMSVHLAFALSLFGRENDKLLHVLTSEEHEFKGFYPANKKEDKALVLAEIPFVRLRSLITSDASSVKILNKKFSDIVEFTQKQLKKVTAQKYLFINIDNRSVTFDNATIIFEPLEFAIYFLFVELVVAAVNPLVTIHQINSAEFGNNLIAFTEDKFSYYYIEDKKKSAWQKLGLDAAVFRAKRTKINSKLETLFVDPDYFDLFKISSIKKYPDTAYTIKADKSKIKIVY